MSLVMIDSFGFEWMVSWFVGVFLGLGWDGNWRNGIVDFGNLGNGIYFIWC
jgi:hypothetical protein